MKQGSKGIAVVPTVDKKESILQRVGLDPFIIALLAMIVLAYLKPSFGAEDGPLPLEEITTYGVSVIFFFYGLRLSPAKLMAGLSDWKLHIVVQLCTFLLFPLIVYVGSLLFAHGENQMLWVGAFYVAALPSTVSSSVVMVSIAGGNIPAAIFNASISSIIGVFITPLWMGLFLTSQASGDYDLTSIFLKLILQVLVPVALGVLLNKRFGVFAEKQKVRLKLFDQTIIILIVYSSFCDSFARRMFEGYSAFDLLILGGAMIGLFFLVYTLITVISKALGFSRENKITAVFCGSKKSLVHGTVMSRVLFPNTDTVGIVLLPLMLYHALQLIAASIIAKRIAKETSLKMPDAASQN